MDKYEKQIMVVPREILFKDTYFQGFAGAEDYDFEALILDGAKDVLAPASDLQRIALLGEYLGDPLSQGRLAVRSEQLAPGRIEMNQDDLGSRETRDWSTPVPDLDELPESKLADPELSR